MVKITAIGSFHCAHCSKAFSTVDNVKKELPEVEIEKIDITKNPEIENVRIDVAFTNLPAGEISNEVQRKIDEAKDDASDLWKIIGD